MWSFTPSMPVRFRPAFSGNGICAGSIPAAAFNVRHGDVWYRRSAKAERRKRLKFHFIRGVNRGLVLNPSSHFNQTRHCLRVEIFRFTGAKGNRVGVPACTRPFFL